MTNQTHLKLSGFVIPDPDPGSHPEGKMDTGGEMLNRFQHDSLLGSSENVRDKFSDFLCKRLKTAMMKLRRGGRPVALPPFTGSRFIKLGWARKIPRQKVLDKLGTLTYKRESFGYCIQC